MSQQQHPAGWYTQPDGSTRYWDGVRWADPAGTGAGAGATPPTKKPWFRRKRFIVPSVALVGLVAIIPKGGDDEAATGAVPSVSASAPEESPSALASDVLTPSASPSQEAAPAVETASPEAAASTEEVVAAVEAPEPEPAAPEPAEPELSVAQRNAVSKAQSYLDFTSFSRPGLIGQLEYEGFSTADAEFAVDHIDVDWSQQAVQSAESYLEFTAFSEPGLIDQLVFEEFTQEQARFGVDNVEADWFEQAALKAESYLEFTSFSRSGLIDQLLFEGFTREQAEHGVTQVGL